MQEASLGQNEGLISYAGNEGQISWHIWGVWLGFKVLAACLQNQWILQNTLQPLYNTVHYNMVLDITQF